MRRNSKVKTKRKIPDSYIIDKEPKFNKMTETAQIKNKRAEVQIALNQHTEAKNQYDSWRKEFSVKQNDLNQKEQQLQERSDNLEEFTQHRKTEISKLRQMIDKQTKKNQIMRDRVSNLEEQSAEEKRKYNKLVYELQGLQRYTDFVQETVDKSSTFDTIEQLLNHYQSMKKTRIDYLLKYQNLITKYSEETKANQLMSEKRESYRIDRALKLQQATRNLTEEVQQSEYRKMELLKDIQRVKDKSIEVATIKSSIRDLYQKTMSKVEGKHTDSSKLTEEEMLSAIKNRFSDLVEIVQASNIQIYEE